jgi:hypothetical protein
MIGACPNRSACAGAGRCQPSLGLSGLPCYRAFAFDRANAAVSGLGTTIPGTDVEITPERILLLLAAGYLVYRMVFSTGARAKRKKRREAKAGALKRYETELARIREQYA